MDDYTRNHFIRDTLSQVFQERLRQEARWGEQNHPDGTGWKAFGRQAQEWKDRNEEAVEGGYLTWAHILLEEVFEACEETDPDKLYTELIQVAAVASAWAEAITRRED